MRRNGLLLAAAAIVITNGVVLIEAANNRRGGPVETIRLTERELPLNTRGKEDSGVSVRLNSTGFVASPDDYSWLDRTKLEELGFDYARATRDPAHPPLPRPAVVVFEYNGAAWEKLRQSVPQTAEASSRLVPIDAAQTPGPLLGKYPDRGKYLIVEGIVQLYVITGPERRLQLRPSISDLLPNSIHVPSLLSATLRSLPVEAVVATNTANPRYTLTLSYGRSLEPWVVSIGGPSKD